MGRGYAKSAGLILVALAMLLASYVTFLSPVRGGLELDLDSQATAQGEVDPSIPLEMQSLKTLYRTINLVQKHYIDATRIDSRAMFVAAMRAVQGQIANLIVAEDKGDLVVRINRDEKRFSLSDVKTPWILLQKIKEAFGFIQEKLPSGELDLQKTEYAAINGMLETLDPHSAFLDPDSYREMKDKTQGNFGGLGIVISIRDGVLTVISPLAGTPADRAGLKAGDQILKIGEMSTVNMALNDAVNMLRGEPKTAVALDILRKGWEEPRAFTIIRDIIKVESLATHLLPGPVGYVQIKDFQGNTARDLSARLEAWNRQGLRGLVIDLRGCPGGLLDAAIRVSDLFLTGGVIVTTAGQGPAERDVRRAGDDGDEPGYPIVVLVDGGSASAAEILAGALKNQGRALVVGQQTFGKGSVQVLYEFQDGAARTSALKLTTSQYLTPGDLSIQSVGISPHVELAPIRADAEMLDLRSEAGYRERDLDRHFEGARPTGAGDAPQKQLAYLEVPEKKEGDGGSPPDGEGAEEEEEPEPLAHPGAFKPDFAIDLARELVIRMAKLGKGGVDLRALDKTLDEKARQQDARLVQALAKLGVDWRIGGETGPATATVEARLEGDRDLEAGEQGKLVVSVTNAGPGAFYRLMATSRSDFPPLADRELAFGRVGPGETVRRELPFKIPKDTLDQTDDVLWSFDEARGRKVDPVAVRFRLRALPRPRLAYRFEVSDAAGGNGDSRIQKGESIALNVDIENRGKGAALNAYATLKSLSGKELFMIRGREPLGDVKPGERKRAVFTFDVKPGFTGDACLFELGLASVDLRVYSVEKIALPVEPPAGDRTPPAASGPVARADLPLQAPPELALDPVDPVVTAPSVRLRGRAADESAVRSVYIFVGNDKVFFKPSAGAGAAKALDFEADLPLKNGLNYITVVAEETKDLDTREVITVRRDRPDGMPFLLARSPLGAPEPIGAIPRKDD